MRSSLGKGYIFKKVVKMAASEMIEHKNIKLPFPFCFFPCIIDRVPKLKNEYHVRGKILMEEDRID